MKYDKIIRSGRAGIFAAPRVIGALRAAAGRAGIAWYDLDLSGVHDRDAFLRCCARVFSLPGYFGNNWDALHECLLDLAASGMPGAVVHWRRGAELVKRMPDAASAALEIVQDAAMYWHSSGRVFLVVADRDSVPGLDLPPLR